MTASQRISAVLEDRALTFEDLVAITGLSRGAVTTGLYQLRQVGILKTETIARQSAKGRPRAIYSLESAA